MNKQLEQLFQTLNLKIDKNPEAKEWREFIGILDDILEENELLYNHLKNELNQPNRYLQGATQKIRKEYETRFRLLMDLIPETVLVLDEQGICHDISGDHTPNEVIGMSREQILGRKINDFVPKSLADAILRAQKKAREENRRQEIQHTLKENEREKVLEIQIKPEEIPGEKRHNYLVVIENVDPENHAQYHASTLQKIFSDTEVGIFIVSLDGSYFYHNSTFEKIFGKARSGKLYDYMDFFHPADYERLKQSIKNDGTFHGEMTIYSGQDRTLSVWLTVGTLDDEEDHMSYRYAFFSDISELQRSQELLEHSATHDALTGLPNRQELMERLDAVLDRSARYERSGALFFIDLDNFKEINDSMGHLTGDTVLIEVGKRIKTVIRKSDIFGRLGGDEFLLIVEEIQTPDVLMNIARKIIEVVNKPIQVGGMGYSVGASIGITIFPHDGRKREELLRYADMAMYRAKEHGRNRYQFYSSSISRKVKEHFVIERALQNALESGGFYLLFQPQVDLSSGSIVGVEALLRMRAVGAQRLLMPEEFIPIAEESDVIIKIGRWVFEQCCRILYSWNRMYGLSTLQMSINLSRRQLMDEEWVDFVAHTMKQYRINPRQIEFEITETAFMHSGKVGSKVMHELKALGCKFSIDDFGTGYSSLSALKEFTVDRLKIDRSFVQEIHDNETDRAIVKASIALAQALGLKIVAEGVETREQQKIIRLLGCDEMQGFLYSRPVSVEEVLVLLRKSGNLRMRKPGEDPFRHS